MLICYTEAMNEYEELLTRGVANIIPGKKELFGKLASGKKLNIYLGIDPTSTKLHLGHAVPLRKLNEFAKKGHNVTFLIGDFTALIGDTSDKIGERPALSTKEIEENFKTYKKQAEKILDFSKVKVRYNSDWLKKLSLEDILKLTRRFSANDFLSRELIKKRLNEGKRIGLNEFLYPAMQGYDSYFMATDLQIGGTDQTFNMQAGRTLIKDLKNKESFVLTTPILEGPDGRKMSKSWGNAIWLDDSPNDMFAKIMAIPDDFILNYFKLATNLSLEKLEAYEKKLKSGKNPRDIKEELARQIVKELHDETSARKAKLGGSVDVVFASPENTVFDIVLSKGLVQSKGEWKRLVEQKGITVDNDVLSNPNATIGKGKLIMVGPKKILKVTPLE